MGDSVENVGGIPPCLRFASSLVGSFLKVEIVAHGKDHDEYPPSGGGGASLPRDVSPPIGRSALFRARTSFVLVGSLATNWYHRPTSVYSCVDIYGTAGVQVPEVVLLREVGALQQPMQLTVATVIVSLSSR